MKLKVEKDGVLVSQATKNGWIKCKWGGVFDMSYPNSKERRGRVQHGGDVSPALTEHILHKVEGNMERLRIRQLTPRECYRLMDFTDEQFDRAAQVNSNSQLYKQAGNSIVVNCLVAVMGQMFEGHERDYEVYK